jgi:hypothetical protein
MFSFLQKINQKKCDQSKHFSFFRSKESPDHDFVYADSKELTESSNNFNNKASVFRSASSSNNDKHATKSPKTHFSRKANLSLSSIGSGYFTTGRVGHKKNKADAALSSHSLGIAIKSLYPRK